MKMKFIALAFVSFTGFLSSPGFATFATMELTEELVDLVKKGATDARIYAEFILPEAYLEHSAKRALADNYPYLGNAEITNFDDFKKFVGTEEATYTFKSSGFDPRTTFFVELSVEKKDASSMVLKLRYNDTFPSPASDTLRIIRQKASKYS